MGAGGGAIPPSADQAPSVPATAVTPASPPSNGGVAAPSAATGVDTQAPSAPSAPQTAPQAPPAPAAAPADPPAAAPPDPPPTQTNNNISIRILSPGNDGPAVQQNLVVGGGGLAPSPGTDTQAPASPPQVSSPTTDQAPASDPTLVMNWNWSCGGSPAPPVAAASSTTVWNWTWTGDCQGSGDMPELNVPMPDLPSMPSTPSLQGMQRALEAPAAVSPFKTRSDRHLAKHRHPSTTHGKRAVLAAESVAPPIVAAQAVSNPHPGGVQRPAAEPRHKSRSAGAPRPESPFKLPLFPDNQAVGPGSSGGTSTPPPAPLAVLLAAATFGASMLVSRLRNARRRRRPRLFSSRLERPG